MLRLKVLVTERPATSCALMVIAVKPERAVVLTLKTCVVALKVTLVGRVEVADQVKLSPASGSVKAVETLKVEAVPAVAYWVATAALTTGASFTLVTVIASALLAVSAPSEATTLTS